MQICQRLACKIACFCTQKCMRLAGKTLKSQVRIPAKRWPNNPPSPGKNTRKRRQNIWNCRQKTCILQAKHPQSHAKRAAIAGKKNSQLQISETESCRWSCLQLAGFITCGRVYSAWGASRVDAGVFNCLYW